jgi:hypothetical protein
LLHGWSLLANDAHDDESHFGCWCDLVGNFRAVLGEVDGRNHCALLRFVSRPFYRRVLWMHGMQKSWNFSEATREYDR